MRVAKATTSKNEKIDDKKINEIIELSLNNKNQMNILLDYIKVKLYIMNDKWIKLMKILYLILALLVKSQNEKEIVEELENNTFSYVLFKDKLETYENNQDNKFLSIENAIYVFNTDKVI